MSGSLSVILKNQLFELERLGQFVEELGETYGLLPKLIFQINLALDEIVTNIISYGYDDDNEHEIICTCSFEDGVITLTIVDDGKPFNPLESLPPKMGTSVEETKIGGLGIHFVRQLMDELEYKRQEGRNVLLLKKANL